MRAIWSGRVKSDLERKSEKQFGAKECEAIWSKRVRSDLERKSEKRFGAKE